VVSRRRFTLAVLIGTAATAIPFCWILWSLWESPNLLRTTTYESNFYDLQARAMFHGHLWLANGSIGIEGFVHGTHQYTYFGLFPSLIRMPILTATSSLDGKLTGPFILAAWLGTGVFAALLLWRVRIFVRGQALMSRAEAVSYGILMATFLGGSVFMVLAATPFTFSEDIAWSICLTVGSMFALLGVIERPSWGRVSASFVLVLAANLDRVTTGWACVVAAVLIAGWFGLGRGGRENRRWCIPLLGVGLVPLLVSCAINYSKFGLLFGVPSVDQLWTKANAYRRQFLAANHNSEVGTAFIPSDIVAYLRPDGLQFSSVFPFITLPARPAAALSGVLFDRRYRTASLPASMPLLFLLSCWGLVTAFRPRPIGKVALTRLLLIASGGAGAALFLWGYIAPRYLGDFVPLLVLASAVALADIWRRLDGRSRRMQIGVMSGIGLVALFTIAANIGMAITPNEEWNPTQVGNYVAFQKSVSDVTGHPVNSRIVRGNSLPPYGPADQLYVIGNCSGLYISNGEDYSTIPSNQLHRATWMTVELGHAFEHTFDVTVNRPQSGQTDTVPLVTAGSTTVSMIASPFGRYGQVRLRFIASGQSQPGPSIFADQGSRRRVVVITDPAKHMVTVTVNGPTYLSRTLTNRQPARSDVSKSGPANVGNTLSVADVTGSTPNPTLCQSLIHQ
jgi:hypothetical protein